MFENLSDILLPLFPPPLHHLPLNFAILHHLPLNFAMLLMYKNVPIVTICWVTFFALCFLIFLVLSLCSESHCACCRCCRCCREGTATVARIPSMVTTTYGSENLSLKHRKRRLYVSVFHSFHKST